MKEGKTVKPRSGRSQTGGKSSEVALLQQLRQRTAQLGSPAVRLGIGDDCALLRGRPGEELAITTDLSIADRHFRLDWHPPEAVGHRTLARGLSDLAAMGARPLAAFLSLGLPRELARDSARDMAADTRAAGSNREGPTTWMSRFLDGLLGLAERHNVPLAGGDLAESPVAVADIVLIGAVPRGQALLRSAARPGDWIYVTGALGGAAVGLELLSQANGKLDRRMERAVAAHLYPQPRIAQGLWLRQRGVARAAIDLSDGLSTDLDHICEESGVSAEIDAAAVPVAPGATIEQALHGGEDYELLFTVRPSARVPTKIADVPVTRIGQVVKHKKGAPPVILITPHGREPLAPHGWQHFS